MDNPELCDLFNDELNLLIRKAHKSGLRPLLIAGLISDRLSLLILQCDAETANLNQSLINDKLLIK
jgi:hypothetical protein